MTDTVQTNAGYEQQGRLSRAALVLSIAFAAWMLTNLDQSLFGYAVPQIQEEFGLSITGIGYIVSLSFIAGMILPVGVGVLTDTIGARWTLPLCLSISAVLVGVQGLLPGLFGFAAARIVSFGLSAALSPITNAIVVAVAPERWRAMMVAVLQSAYPLGWLLSSLMVAPLIEQLGWRILFFVGFLVAPIAILLGYLLPKDQFGPKNKQVAAAQATDPAEASYEEGAPAPLKAMFSSTHIRKTVLCGLSFFFNSGAVAATAFYLPVFLTEVRGYSVSDSALIVGTGYGVSVIGYLAAAAVSTYWLSRRNTIMIWNLLAAVFVGVMLWVPQTITQDFIAFAVMDIFYYGTSAILITYLLESFPGYMRATAAAVSGTACVSASMAVFPVVTAELVTGIGWQMAFFVVVIPSLIMSALAVWAMPAKAPTADQLSGTTD